MVASIHEREKRITQLAYHDGETRLPNRRALERSLAATTQQERLYLAAIGVDRFAHVRGAIGYTLAGDVAAHARRALGARWCRTRRWRGFPATCWASPSSPPTTPTHASAPRAVVNNLEQPLSLDGQVVDVNVTIGVAQPRARTKPPPP